MLQLTECNEESQTSARSVLYQCSLLHSIEIGLVTEHYSAGHLVSNVSHITDNWKKKFQDLVSFPKYSQTLLSNITCSKAYPSQKFSGNLSTTSQVIMLTD